MKLTIESAVNGFILRDDFSEMTTVIETEDKAEGAAKLLWEIIDTLGLGGSRYDEKRVRVNVEPGDKWISPAEAAGIPSEFSFYKDAFTGNQ